MIEQMDLDQEQIVRTLMAARLRIAASVWVVTRDHQVAEDIFQNVSVKALAGGSTFETEAQLVSWALVCGRHEALNWLRSRKNRMLVLDEAVLALLDGDASQPAGERVEALRECLADIPEDSRKLVELRYFEGRSCGDVARVLHLNLAAVYQRLSRLHRALRDCVEHRVAGANGGLPSSAK